VTAIARGPAAEPRLRYVSSNFARDRSEGRTIMLRLAVVFLLLALLTAVLGVVGLLGWLAKFIFVGLLVLFIICATVSAVMTKARD
jgi:uncharacterized membrane protein YtjA (UPF0391 family)